MPRSLRNTPGGYIYHVLNRAVARHALFQKNGDYEAFERVFEAALTRHPIRVLAYTIMPNHWHLVLWPEHDGQLSAFVGWLSLTHATRWHAHRHSTGTGHLYQGRFKSFPIETDEYLLSLLRYVERNPLRANLVDRAEKWPWSSLWLRENPDERTSRWLSDWPVFRPGDWLERVNEAQTAAEVDAIRRSVARGAPYGGRDWQRRIAKDLGLESSLRPRGRPRKIEVGIEIKAGPNY